MYLFDLFLLFISITSIFNIVLLTIGKFSALNALTFALVISLLIIKIFKLRIKLKDERFDKWIFLILLLALAFRYKPYLYIMGAQDQGTYVLMSRQYELQGSLNYHDYFRDTLTKEQQELYDKHDPYLLPGFQKWGSDRSNFIMKLYPLHPSWMAIFGSIFGRDNRVYSLTMFSLISIYALYLLGYEMSGKKRAGYLAALFLAVNPAHTFFSKFPVTEIVALAFTSSSFYYLLKYYHKPNRFYLIISALLINAFYYTRMSSFMYMPFYYLLTASVVLIIKNKNVKKDLLIYLAFVFALFGISFLFYKEQMPALFYEIYHSYFLALGANKFLLGIIAMFAVLPIKILGELKKRQQKNIIYLANRILPATLLLTTAIPIILSVTTSSFTKTLLYGTILHISPIILALYPVFVLRICKKSKELYLLAIFIAFFFVIATSLILEIPYHYYHLRYAISEVIPFYLLLGALTFDQIHKKRTLILGVIITILCFIPFTLIQTQGTEGPQINSYKEIVQTIGKNDLLLVNKNYRSGSAMMAPLKYFYNLNTLIIDKTEDLADPNITSLTAKFDKTFLLTDETLKDKEKLKDIKIKYGYFNTPNQCSTHAYSYLSIESQKQIINGTLACFLPPTSYYTVYEDLYLYKIK